MQIKKAESKNPTGIAIHFLNLLHFALSLAMFYTAWLMFRYGTIFTSAGRGRYNYYVLILYTVLFLFFMNTYNGYMLGYISVKRLVFYQFLSQFLSAAIVYIIVTFAWAKLRSPLVYLLMLAEQMLVDIIWTIPANKYYIKRHGTRSTVLVYGNELYKKFFDILKGKPSEQLYRIDKEIQYSGDDFDELKDQIKDYEAVFSVGVHLHCRNDMMKYCKEIGASFFFLPTIGDVVIKESGHLKSFDAPVFYVTRTRPDPNSAFAKRAFDIVFSALGLLALSPVMLITGLAIRLYDGGPAIYKQDRLTKDGKVFKIYKFRSMTVDAEEDGVARFSTGDQDERVTPIGRIIRRIRFDELPQLWNILCGDMSFVGPRPERPEIAEQLYEYLPDFRLRLQAKAGLTGYAQIYGRYNTDPYEKLVFDLLYINHLDFKTDIMLLFATVAILFSSNSTKGFENSRENLKPDEYREYDILHEDI